MKARIPTLVVTSVVLVLTPASAQAVKTFINYSNQTANRVCAGGVESTYAADNAARLKTLLVGYGFDVRTSDDFYGSNAAAASWGATSFLSIHSNAGGGHGAETLKGWYGNSSAFATKVQAGLMSKIPFQSRGVKSGTCGGGRCRVLNYSGQTAALVEVVFHDCCTSSGYTGHPPSEAAYLVSSSGRQTIASGLAKGLCDYHGVSCTGSTPPPSSLGSLKGVVYKNGDLNQHVAPATIRLSSGATTSYNGSSVWSFDVPAGSSYTITASAAGFHTATRNCNAVTAGSITYCSIELEAEAPATSTGFIKGTVYKNGDTTDRVVPATLTLSTGATASYTDAGALWSFEVPVSGSYAMTAGAAGYDTVTRSCGAVTAGATTWCSVELVPTAAPSNGVLQGIVYRDGNQASVVAPATVTLNTGSTTTYNGMDAWSFTLSPASYTVTVAADGFATRSNVACPMVPAGGRVQCDVELQPLAVPDAGHAQDDAGEVESDAGSVGGDASSADTGESTDVGGGDAGSDTAIGGDDANRPSVSADVVELGDGFGCAAGPGRAPVWLALPALLLGLVWRRRTHAPGARAVLSGDPGRPPRP
ncbi:MAG: N-acetylmuramoyl-L-alanine amidase [Pseudomonadota bacterium]